MRNKILVVDDEKFNRRILIDILQDTYTVIEAENGLEALRIIEEQRKEIAAIFLDIVMPEMDGITFLKTMSQKDYLGAFPVLVVTGEQSAEQVAECFEYGASDYIRKPVNKAFVKQRLSKLLALYEQKNEFKERLDKQTLTMRSQYRLLQQQALQLKKNQENIISILGTVVEYRNLEARTHITRVKGFTKIIGTYMMKLYPEYGLTGDKINAIASASVLHDIGKVMLSDAILLKPGKLTAEEFEYVKSHSIKGYDIVESIADMLEEEYVQICKEIVRWHHEKYDGSGYPDGLQKEEIPISAQIVSIADCFESLLSESVYKGAIPFEEAYNMILQGECGMFSYKLLECFRKAKNDLQNYAKQVEKSVEETSIPSEV
ncbi:MAG: response regulator [Lachnospiraceae bacterium]|nr:response regulator [Lachnospiraceae bacterium]